MGRKLGGEWRSFGGRSGFWSRIGYGGEGEWEEGGENGVGIEEKELICFFCPDFIHDCNPRYV